MGLGSYVGVPKSIEILLLSFFGISSTIFDAAMMDLNSNIYKIWDMRLDSEKFSERFELYSKYILTAVVMFRTFTVHLYLGCYFVLLYPTIFEERPGLILPWIFVNATKCILTGFICATFGLYTCLKYSFRQPACWEFIITRFMEQSPSIYMFVLVVGDLKNRYTVVQFIDSDDLVQTITMDSFETIKPSARCLIGKSSMSAGDIVSKGSLLNGSRLRFEETKAKVAERLLTTRSCPEFTDYTENEPEVVLYEEREASEEEPKSKTLDTQTEHFDGLNVDSLGEPNEQGVVEVASKRNSSGLKVRRTSYKNDGYTQAMLERSNGQ